MDQSKKEPQVKKIKKSKPQSSPQQASQSTDPTDVVEMSTVEKPDEQRVEPSESHKVEEAGTTSTAEAKEQASKKGKKGKKAKPHSSPSLQPKDTSEQKSKSVHSDPSDVKISKVEKPLDQRVESSESQEVQEAVKLTPVVEASVVTDLPKKGKKGKKSKPQSSPSIPTEQAQSIDSADPIDAVKASNIAVPPEVEKANEQRVEPSDSQKTEEAIKSHETETKPELAPIEEGEIVTEKKRRRRKKGKAQPTSSSSSTQKEDPSQEASQSLESTDTVKVTIRVLVSPEREKPSELHKREESMESYETPFDQAPRSPEQEVAETLIDMSKRFSKKKIDTDDQAEIPTAPITDLDICEVEDVAEIVKKDLKSELFASAEDTKSLELEAGVDQGVSTTPVKVLESKEQEEQQVEEVHEMEVEAELVPSTKDLIMPEVEKKAEGQEQMETDADYEQEENAEQQDVESYATEAVETQEDTMSDETQVESSLTTDTSEDKTSETVEEKESDDEGDYDLEETPELESSKLSTILEGRESIESKSDNQPQSLTAGSDEKPLEAEQQQGLETDVESYATEEVENQEDTISDETQVKSSETTDTSEDITLETEEKISDDDGDYDVEEIPKRKVPSLDALAAAMRKSIEERSKLYDQLQSLTTGSDEKPLEVEQRAEQQQGLETDVESYATEAVENQEDTISDETQVKSSETTDTSEDITLEMEEKISDDEGDYDVEETPEHKFSPLSAIAEARESIEEGSKSDDQPQPLTAQAEVHSIPEIIVDEPSPQRINVKFTEGRKQPSASVPPSVSRTGAIPRVPCAKPKQQKKKSKSTPKVSEEDSDKRSVRSSTKQTPPEQGYIRSKRFPAPTIEEVLSDDYADRLKERNLASELSTKERPPITSPRYADELVPINRELFNLFVQREDACSGFPYSFRNIRRWFEAPVLMPRRVPEPDSRDPLVDETLRFFRFFLYREFEVVRETPPRNTIPLLEESPPYMERFLTLAEQFRITNEYYEIVLETRNVAIHKVKPLELQKKLRDIYEQSNSTFHGILRVFFLCAHLCISSRQFDIRTEDSVSSFPIEGVYEITTPYIYNTMLTICEQFLGRMIVPIVRECRGWRRLIKRSESQRGVWITLAEAVAAALVACACTYASLEAPPK